MPPRGELGQTGSREKVAIVATSQQRLEDLRFFDEECTPLLDNSDVRSDNEGNIHWITWREVRIPTTRDALVIYPRDRRVNLSAPYTRYRRVKEPIVTTITDADGEGAIEIAIRTTDHILFENKAIEQVQAEAVEKKANEKLFIYSLLFGAMTPEMFKQNKQQVVEMLGDLGLNLTDIMDTHKKRMTQFLLKGIEGIDSTDRRNWLITYITLLAAGGEAYKRIEAISEADKKFLGIRQTLIEARTVIRENLTDVSELLRHQAMPGHVIFRHSERAYDSDWSRVVRMLGDAVSLLEQANVRPYLLPANDARKLLANAIELLKGRSPQEIKRLELFQKAKEILDTTLNDHKDIYPQ